MPQLLEFQILLQHLAMIKLLGYTNMKQQNILFAIIISISIIIVGLMIVITLKQGFSSLQDILSQITQELSLLNSLTQ